MAPQTLPIHAFLFARAATLALSSLELGRTVVAERGGQLFQTSSCQVTFHFGRRFSAKFFFFFLPERLAVCSIRQISVPFCARSTPRRKNQCRYGPNRLCVREGRVEAVVSCQKFRTGLKNAKRTCQRGQALGKHQCSARAPLRTAPCA